MKSIAFQACLQGPNSPEKLPSRPLQNTKNYPEILKRKPLRHDSFCNTSDTKSMFLEPQASGFGVEIRRKTKTENETDNQNRKSLVPKNTLKEWSQNQAKITAKNSMPDPNVSFVMRPSAPKDH